MNTNLAKTPTLFTVEFQELLEIFWETCSSIHRNFLPSVALIHTLLLQNVAFYTKQDIPRALSFPRVFFRFFLNRSTANKRGSIWRDILEIEANAVKYIHTYIHIYILKSQMRVASGTGNPGWSRTRPELVCFQAWCLRSKNSVCIRDIKKRELVNMYRENF